MHPIDFSIPSHAEDASAILRRAGEDFRKAHRAVPINITELSWVTAWSDLVRIASYKDGAEISEVGSTCVGSFVGMEALRPYTASEIANTLYNIASWVWGAGGDFMSNDVRADPIQDMAALIEQNMTPLAQRLDATLAGQHSLLLSNLCKEQLL